MSKTNGKSHLDLSEFPEFQRPVIPQDLDKVERRGNRWRFYQTISWDKYWDEFNTTIDKKGRMLYPTAWSFAKVKGHNSMQQDVIYQCIGPRPKDLGKTREQPWLGDWERRRSQGFSWVLKDPECLKSLRIVIKERQTAMDACRALGPIVAKQIARLTRAAEHVDEAFGGQPLLSKYPPDSEANKRRFKAYLSMHAAINRLLREVTEQWLQAHGLNPSMPEQWLAMLGAGVMGAALGSRLPGGVEGNEFSQADLLLAHAIIQKGKIYELESPTLEAIPVVDDEEVKEGKGNGKVH